MAGFRKKRDHGRETPSAAAPAGHAHAPYGGAPQGYPPQYGAPGPAGAPYGAYAQPHPGPPQHGYPPQQGFHPQQGYPAPDYGQASAPGQPGGAYPHGGPEAGGAPPAPTERLPWKQLLTGVVFRPSDTYWQMRDHPVWVPAILVSFLYGMVAVFGLEDARQTVLDTTTSNLAPYLLVTGVAMVFGALVLSTVTHALARNLGGNGHWAPTAGLAMLIMTLTEVPRLALAVFLGGGHPVVQVVGWATWLYAGLLLTMMVSRSHELAWPRALAASTIQLLGILMLVKLGTL